MKQNYLVTGAAGFIGYFLCLKLLEDGKNVIGIDNINEYYDIDLKYTRLNTIKKYKNFVFIKCDISNKKELEFVFKNNDIHYVINLAAQAGVRYSIENPEVYISSNIVGFYNVLEACRNYPVKHLMYASSSSVYGSNSKVPFEESDFVDHPVSLYAATKKSNELMAYTYSHLYNIPSTGLRFFTVYGPLGRPDMAYFNFVEKYFKNEEIEIYNDGDFENDLYRDFTFIDDVVEGIIRIIHIPPVNLKPMSRVLNIGNNKPEKLMDFIVTLEKCLSVSLGKNVEFNKTYRPIVSGDVRHTYASTELLKDLINFKPNTSLRDGLQKFTDWYVNYYKKVKQ